MNSTSGSARTSDRMAKAFAEEAEALLAGLTPAPQQSLRRRDTPIQIWRLGPAGPPPGTALAAG